MVGAPDRGEIARTEDCSVFSDCFSTEQAAAGASGACGRVNDRGCEEQSQAKVEEEESTRVERQLSRTVEEQQIRRGSVIIIRSAPLLHSVVNVRSPTSHQCSRMHATNTRGHEKANCICWGTSKVG